MIIIAIIWAVTSTGYIPVSYIQEPKVYADCEVEKTKQQAEPYLPIEPNQVRTIECITPPVMK